jgi:hypothetical protein
MTTRQKTAAPRHFDPVYVGLESEAQKLRTSNCLVCPRRDR